MQLGIPLDWTFRIAVALAAALSAGAFTRLLSNGSLPRSLFLCAVTAVALMLLPGREFGQREHLAVLAALPYVALVSRRIEKNTAPSNGVAIAMGIAAGLGFALKPYFLAVPALVELGGQILTRRQLRLFRAENLAIGGVMLAYALVILIFEQDYLWQSVPLANEIYWSFNRALHWLWEPLLFRLMFIVPITAFAIYQRDAAAVLLTAACCGFIFSFIIQQKGYHYHLLPISVMTLVILAHLAVRSGRLVSVTAAVATAAMFAVLVEPVAGWWNVNKPGGRRAAEIERIATSINAHAPNGKFLIVAVHPYPTFPTAIYTPAHHVSRTNSQWFMPAVVQIRSGLTERRDSASIERHAREFILHDLAREPDIVLIDKDSVRHTEASKSLDLLAFYQEDEEFRALWRNYLEIEPIGNYRQFVRVKVADR